MTRWDDMEPYMVDYSDADHHGIKEAAARWAAAIKKKPEALKRQYGVPDFLAMTTDHDPFYMGAPATVAAAKWFMEVWKQQGMDRRAASGKTVYVRSMHYTATADNPAVRITPPPPPWGGGRAYTNEISDYRQMINASAAARYLGMLPFDAIIDNRNKDSEDNADEHPFQDEMPYVAVNRYTTRTDELTLPPPYAVVATPSFDVEGYIASQRHLLAVVTEKDVVRELIMPTLQRFEADYILASGETSITQTYAFCVKALRRNRSARLFYLSDYDPAGNNMPLSFARRIEWLVHSPESPFFDEFQEYLAEGHDITLQPIAITKEQMEQYDFPRTMLKTHVVDTRPDWLAKHGDRGAELNVLDLEQYDGVLERIVAEALEPFYDDELEDEVSEAENAAIRTVREREVEVIASYRPRLDELQAEYLAIYNEIRPKLDAIRESINYTLSDIEEALEEARGDIEDEVIAHHPVPVAAESDADLDEMLLWTARNYFDQLVMYKRHLGRNEPGKLR